MDVQTKAKKRYRKHTKLNTLMLGWEHGWLFTCDMAGTIDGCADTSKTKHRTHKIEHAEAGLGAWMVVHMHTVWAAIEDMQTKTSQFPLLFSRLDRLLEKGAQPRPHCLPACNSDKNKPIFSAF
jgi:hypothetical protein